LILPETGSNLLVVDHHIPSHGLARKLSFVKIIHGVKNKKNFLIWLKQKMTVILNG
jgi:hypothetical protein